MLDLFAMIVPALLISMCAKLLFSKTITTHESLITCVINIGVALLFISCLFVSKQFKMVDEQVLSGYVMSKSRDKVSCSHSYNCKCYDSCTGSGKNKSCTRRCKTCYDHSYDISWRVQTTLSDYSISRIDRQGLKEPPRWSVVQIDEPVAETSMYKNYLLADEKTLFVETLANNHYAYPSYPSVFDYWKINRVIGVPSPLGEQLNTMLNDVLKTLGPAKQLNVVLVMTTHPEEYFNGLMAHWKGGKKNDVILVYGVDKDMNTVWFNSNSYAMGMNNKELHSRLKDNALGKKLDAKEFTIQMATISKHFNRMPASEFEFKAQSIEISTTTMLVLVLLNIFVAVGVSVFMHKNDISSNRR